MIPDDRLWHRPAGSSNRPARGGYVDIHAHLIPGVDDGPPDLEAAVDMARAAVSVGIGTIATTPHLRSDFPDVHLEEIASRCDVVREALAREGIPLEVIPAAEVSLPWAIEATDEQLALASYGQRATDLLIETPFTGTVGLDRFLSLLRSRGYRVTLAHPERSAQFQRDHGPLRDLVDQGVLLQVNAGSLLGPGNRGRRRLARTLLEEGLAHAVASDGHRGDHWRPVTLLADGAAAAAELVGEQRARWLAIASPGAIVVGEDLPPAPAVKKAEGRRRLFGRRPR